MIARRPLVLFANGIRDVRELYGLYLRQDGIEVELAVSGADALDKAISIRPDVIVLDSDMPGMTNLDAVGTLKSDSRTRDIPVVLVTAYPRSDIARAAHAAGCDSYLAEPHIPEVLTVELRRHVYRASR
jgi:CheY-like chemotaxis protein